MAFHLEKQVDLVLDMVKSSLLPRNIQRNQAKLFDIYINNKLKITYVLLFGVMNMKVRGVCLWLLWN